MVARVLNARRAPQYFLSDRLGTGGMGVVHLGLMVTPAGRRRVAIKQLLAASDMTDGATERIAAEARLVFQLTHANICQVLDLGINDQGTFIVMEFVSGLDLHSLLRNLASQRLQLAVPCAI